MGVTRMPRRLAVVAAALVAAVAVSGCGIVRPAGDAPLRYRDAIFSTVTITRDLQYGSAPDGNGNPVALKLDLYQPPATDTVNKRPAIVWVHGGGFTAATRRSGPSPDLANKFAKLGYVTVSINYRLSGPASGCVGTGFPPQCITATFDAQHDAQAAIRWLRAHAATYGIDSGRIAIGGESAGGITATLAGLRADDPGTSGNPGFSSSVRAFSSISGGILNGVFVDAGDTAGIFFHGTADNIVPVLLVGGHGQNLARRRHDALPGAVRRCGPRAVRPVRRPDVHAHLLLLLLGARPSARGRSAGWRRPGPPSGRHSSTELERRDPPR